MSTEDGEPTRDASFVIVHATDLAPEGQRTFDHAFALAREADARVVTLHVADDEVPGDVDPDEMLARLASAEDAIDHEIWVEEGGGDAEWALIAAVRRLEPDLLVVGTRRQTGDKSSFSGSVSERAALKSEIPTLVVHIGQEGIVDGVGQLRLHRILVPVGDEAEARASVGALTELLDQTEADDVDIYLLRVGDRDFLSEVDVPRRDGWRWHREVRERGFVGSTISEYCDEKDIDLIAMATRGPNSLMDALSGSKTQKVIRRAPRPVLTVAVGD